MVSKAYFEKGADRWFIRGSSDEVTTCGICGRSELKGTMVLETPDGETIYCGSDCGARLAGKPAAALRKEQKAADDRKKDEERKARAAAQAAAAGDEEAKIMFWLRSQYPQAKATRDPRDGFAEASGKSWFQLRKDWAAAGKP